MERGEPTGPPTQGYTLLTGATGLLGRYLMRDLLREGHALAVLVRPAKGVEPTARIDAILADEDRGGDGPLPRPVVLAGDVAADDLGLDASDRRWLGENTTRWVHGAADTRFNGRSRKGEPWRTNEVGARNVFSMCRALGIEDLHHISTAYVSGDRPGRVLESELGLGQGFRNDYEESKYAAEEELRASNGIAHKTVYRPGVIAGDSRTGYTSTYYGLYVYLRALSIVLPRIRPDAQGVRRIPYATDAPLEAPRNIVPVDWVAQVVVSLLETPEARGHTYHLTPRQPVANRTILDSVGSWYGEGPVELCAPSRWSRGLRFLSFAVRMLRAYESYGGAEPTFDTRNLDRFAGDLPCPPLDEAMVHRYLAYAERDDWGRNGDDGR